MLHMLARGR